MFQTLRFQRAQKLGWQLDTAKANPIVSGPGPSSGFDAVAPWTAPFWHRRRSKIESPRHRLDTKVCESMKQGWFQPQHARILSHELRKLFEIAAKAGADSNYLVYSGGPTMVLNPKVFRREDSFSYCTCTQDCTILHKPLFTKWSFRKPGHEHPAGAIRHCRPVTLSIFSRRMLFTDSHCLHHWGHLWLL